MPHTVGTTGYPPSSRIVPEADFVFEVSWEACNKVGGIYTVLTSKAARMNEWYKSRYWIVGPYRPHHAEQEFRELKAPVWFSPIIEELGTQGIFLHYGRWDIKGKPQAILVECEGYAGRLNEIKKRLWEWHQIDSLGSPHDFDEPLIWSWAVGVFLEKAAAARRGERGVFHFHEWLSCGGLLYVKRMGVEAGLVFTTHATVIGRALASKGVDIYREMAVTDAAKAAYEYGVQAKHGIEQAAAEAAHIFTTVSEITAAEATAFLGRRPDVLLPNGLDIVQFPTIREEVRRHEGEKARLFDFLGYYFFPYYAFDPRETLFYFTVSRYEFRDKGVDIFIRALGVLNRTLAEKKNARTVVAFFWIPADNAGIRRDVADLRVRYANLLRRLGRGEDGKNPRDRFFRLLDHPSEAQLGHLGFGLLRELREFKRTGTPPLGTHELTNRHDSILAAFAEAGLMNRAEDKVKVVLCPIYLSPNDGIFDLGYWESMQAAHLGVFASFYEPWGYTPLEAAALGVPAITTDLTGFGRYVGVHEKRGAQGIYILRRSGVPDDEATAKLADTLLAFSRFSRRKRHHIAAGARKLAELADWKYFIRHYVYAHNLAVAKSRG